MAYYVRKLLVDGSYSEPKLISGTGDPQPKMPVGVRAIGDALGMEREAPQVTGMLNIREALTGR